MDKNIITVFDGGTTVKLKGTGLTGIITAVIIRGRDVSYEITYFNTNKEAMVICLSDTMFTVTKDKNFKIGFHEQD